MVNPTTTRLLVGAEASAIGQWQADRVFDLLCREAPHCELETASLSGVGTLLESLQSGGIDVAVCAVGSLPACLPEGLDINAWLPRGPVENVLLGCSTLKGLPTNTVISVRNDLCLAQVLEHCPHAVVEVGSPDTASELRRLDAGELGALIVPRWELVALCEAHRSSTVLSPTEFLPSAGQGVTAVLVRTGSPIHERITIGMNHATTRALTEVEQAVAAGLTELVGIFSVSVGDRLTLHGKRIDVDGTLAVTASAEGQLGDDLGARLLAALRP